MIKPVHSGLQVTLNQTTRWQLFDPQMSSFHVKQFFFLSDLITIHYQNYYYYYYYYYYQ